jgi:mRNA interferase MazF
MNVQRGDVVLVPIRFSSGSGAKLRPVLVVQSDHNNRRLHDTIVAVITSTVTRATKERTQLLVDISTPDGKQSGLLQPSAITCEHLHTILQADIHRKIGTLSTPLLQQIDACLKASLGIA